MIGITVKWHRYEKVLWYQCCMKEWVIRSAIPGDEPCLVSMWVRGLCSGHDARAVGLKEAAVRGSDAQVKYWEQLQPIATALVRSLDVKVAVDPERAGYEPGLPSVIWGWAAVDRDIVYGFGVKRRIVRDAHDLALDIARDLLGDALDRPMRTVLDLVDLATLRMIPHTWKRELGWAASLRQVSQRVIERDSMYQTIAAYILDPSRERWVPNSKRSAA